MKTTLDEAEATLRACLPTSVELAVVLDELRRVKRMLAQEALNRAHYQQEWLARGAEIERLQAENYRLSEELKETSRLYSAMRFFAHEAKEWASIQGETK